MENIFDFVAKYLSGFIIVAVLIATFILMVMLCTDDTSASREIGKALQSIRLMRGY